MHNTYGSEGECIKKCLKEEEEKKMTTINNNGGKITLDSLLKIAQLAVFPILAGMIWLLLEIFSVKSNQYSISAKMDAMPKIVEQVTELAKTVAVIQDRQIRVMLKQDSMETRIGIIDEELSRHRERSTYDPARPRR